MAVGQIISRAIATGAIGADQIATGAITAADIPAGEITADKLHQTLDFSTKTFTMANAHVTQAMVTQHQSALSVTESQVSDLQSYVLPNTSPTFTNTTLTGYLAGPASFVIDPAGVGDNTGTVVIAGNLQVDGTQTTINSTTVSIDDLKLSVATDAANSAAANGAGITVGGANANITYTHATTSWDFDKPVNVTGAITATGISQFSDVNIPDNNAIRFGNSQDLQIYHDGSDSYITDTTGGNFFINDDGAGYLMMKGSDLYFRDTNNADMIHAQSTGYVKLYHSGSEKLSTTATGINVIGTVTADGLTVENTSGSTLNINTVLAGADSKILLHEGSTASPANGASIRYAGTTNEFSIGVGSSVDTKRLSIARDTGDISFYEDTGTTAKFFWDASAESLGIGTSSPNGLLELDGKTSDSPSMYISHNGNSSVGALMGFHGGNDFRLWNYENGVMKFGSNNAEAMRIDSSGNVGIGTQNPSTKLEVAGTTKAEQYLLDAIDKDISDTAVDVFVYDTRKDSDGGAWRKRTQATSWYNETLNTSTRGSRKEFPSVAVIVAESNQVTIYDGDDPDMPMWMVFETNSSDMLASGILSLTMLNGVLAVGRNTPLHVISFVSDGHTSYSPTSRNSYLGAIGQRNSGLGFSANLGTPYVVANVGNDIAMTVLPNAPIDADTGLPVPTIAVATDGGVSVIKDNGTVVDVNDSLGGTRPVDQVIIRGNDVTTWNVNNGTMQQFFDALTLSSSSTNDCKYNYTYGGGGGGTENVTAILRATLSGGVYLENGKTYRDVHLGNADGVSKIYDGYDREFSTNTFSIFDSLVAYMTSDYNTGWMNGDIKLATLSDTSTTNVTGSELVTNGTFDSDTSGWTAAFSTLSVTSGTLQVVGTGNFNYATQTVTGLTIGKKYVFQADIVTGSGNTYIYVRRGDNGGGITNGSANGVGSYALTFEAPTTSVEIRLYQIYTTTSTFDNVSIRLAEEDRSVNGNGLQVFGTVTKSAVATGADLVAYSGFSNSTNYLFQPYNSDLDFGTGDFNVTLWFNTPDKSAAGTLLHRGSNDIDDTSWATNAVTQIEFNTSNLYALVGTNNFGANSGPNVPLTSISNNTWHHYVMVRRSGRIYAYLDGNYIDDAANTLTNTNSTGKVYIGERPYASRVFNGSLALYRISGTAPSAEQIKKIYEDEKFLFQENAKATLYGSSDAVTALAYDDDTELLHVGTSAGRSVFQGLRRIDNTTDAVGAAISASNGMVAED